MATKSDSEHIVSFLATRNHSSRALALGLAFILVCMAGGFGFLLLQFRNVAETSADRIKLTSTRCSFLLRCYQQGIDAYNLAGSVVDKRSSKSALRGPYAQKVDSCQELRRLYWSMLGSDAIDTNFIRPAASVFFSHIDTLLLFTSAVFSSSGSDADVSAIPEKSRVIFEAGASDFFARARRARDAAILREMDATAVDVRQGSDSTRTAAGRWFLVSGLLFMFAGGLSFVVIAVAGRANLLMQGLKRIVADTSSPIEITDASGKVLYINAAYEKWRRTLKSDLAGTEALSNLTLFGGTKNEKTSWEVVRRTLESAGTWSGEAEIHGGAGEISFAAIVVFPVIDRHKKLQEAVWVFQDVTQTRQLTRQLEETKTQHHLLIENSRDAIVVIQLQRIVFVNSAAVRIFGYGSEDEMKRHQFLDIVAPPSRPHLQIDIERSLAGQDILSNYEMKGLTQSGTLVDLELDARTILWNDQKALYASFHDISARKSLERQQAVWLWEQETLRTIDRQLLGIVDLQRVLDVILQQVMILTRSQFVGIFLVDTANHQGHWRAVLGNRSVLSGNVHAPTRELTAILSSRDPVVVGDDESAKGVSISHVPGLEGEGIVSLACFPIIVNAQPRGIVAVGFRQAHTFAEKETRILSSMKERVSIAIASGELYENLVKREKELELLSGARAHAQEEERRRISREIHDGLGQLLTAIKLNLEMLEDDVVEQEGAGKRIGEVKQLLDNVLQEAREISYNLMPSVLDDFGLGPGLQSLCEQFAKRTGLKISFREHGLKERLAPEVEIGLYRIVQEALNNVAKHAEAKEVSVQIVRHEGKLQMTIEDDGKGMDGGIPLRKPTTSGGTGLVSMRERASSFDGKFLIESSPGKGTVISVEIPATGD